MCGYMTVQVKVRVCAFGLLPPRLNGATEGVMRKCSAI